jgi:hypothetical protein
VVRILELSRRQSRLELLSTRSMLSFQRGKGLVKQGNDLNFFDRINEDKEAEYRIASRTKHHINFVQLC